MHRGEQSVESEAPVAAREPALVKVSSTFEDVGGVGEPSCPMTDSAFTSVGMPKIGDVVGTHYRLDGILGRGGTSVVYRATHLELEQEVAVKILAASALVVPQYVTRLKQEARAAARIHSPHVVRVQDAGELPPQGIPYLVMELLEGADLGAILAKDGPFPVGLAIACILQSIDAIGAAHRLGIVHRDLKPANLFMTRDESSEPFIKVLDFGISRMTTRPALSPLTDPGTVLGTPHYMSPEQMEASSKIDARSDIFALGAILYQLLLGRPPFPGTALPQIYMKIMRSPPERPSTERKDVPRELDAVVLRCLSAEPKERFASVAELARALRAVRVVMGPEAAQDRTSRPSIMSEATCRSEHAVTLASANVTGAPFAAHRHRSATLGSSLGALVLGGALTMGALAIPKLMGVATEEPVDDDARSIRETSAARVLADGIPALSLPTVHRPAAPIDGKIHDPIHQDAGIHGEATSAIDAGVPREPLPVLPVHGVSTLGRTDGASMFPVGGPSP